MRRRRLLGGVSLASAAGPFSLDRNRFLEKRGNGMEDEGRDLAARLEAATGLLSKMLNGLDERLAAASALSGEVERISATVEQSRREEELTANLTAVQRELEELKAAAAEPSSSSVLRKTVPASTTEMLAKRGIGDGPVDVRALDAALSGLSLEQRIAVKTQLLRAGAVA
jgi:prophage DNA circulation protein